MKHLGIDFGTKRVGIAMSDDNGIMAFPVKILPTSKNLVLEVLGIIEDEAVRRIVIGRSLANDGTENPVMEHAKRFAEKLKKELAGTLGGSIEIVWQDEFGTTAHIKAFDEMFVARGNVENKEKGGSDKEKVYDDRAATLILQRYLDSHMN